MQHKYVDIALLSIILILSVTLWRVWPQETTTTTESAAVVQEQGTEFATNDIPKTPSVTKPASSSAQSQGAGVRTFEKGVYVTQVNYTENGFVPATLEIQHGEEVRFVNKTSLTMRIAADEKLSAIPYQRINQAQSVGKGGTYQIALTEKGVLSYVNLNTKPAKTGNIYVK